jgi:hypothetical protein
MDFESIAKIVFGGGIFLFLIERLIEFIRDLKLKRRLTKEIAWEFFVNEFCAMKIIKDFQNLQKDPIGYLDRHIFKTQVIQSVLSSGYYLKLDFNLSQLILEFAQRLKIVQYELERFFSLEDDQKIMPINLGHLERGESDSKRLLYDLSRKLKKLKKKYYKNWQKHRAKQFEEIFKIKVDPKELEQALEIIRKEWSQ